jgi:hypothetical protein
MLEELPKIMFLCNFRYCTFNVVLFMGIGVTVLHL